MSNPDDVPPDADKSPALGTGEVVVGASPAVTGSTSPLDELLQRKPQPPSSSPPPPPPPTNSSAPTSKWPPPITLAILAVSIALFSILNYAPTLVPMDVVAPSAAQIWHGAVWGLVTSVVVHLQIWHLGFNMWWARDFGRLLEPKLGPIRFVAFILAAAVVSSGCQLLFSDTTGIGFSGVVYALFGFVAAKRKSNPDFKAFVTPQTMRWMLGWLVLCIVLTAAKIWTVGNAAHVSGLLFGWLVGTFTEKPRMKLATGGALAILAALAVLSTTYMPWSDAWQKRDALLKLQDAMQRATAGDAKAQAEIGSWYVRYPEQRAEGVELLRKSAEAGNVDAMNALAWVRATCTDAKFRNGEEAVRWAGMAQEREPNASHADTLAASYAEAGRWDEAIAMQRNAIDRLKPEELALRKDLDAHLSRIEKHESIRD